MLSSRPERPPLRPGNQFATSGLTKRQAAPSAFLLRIVIHRQDGADETVPITPPLLIAETETCRSPTHAPPCGRAYLVANGRRPHQALRPGPSVSDDCPLYAHLALRPSYVRKPCLSAWLRVGSMPLLGRPSGDDWLGLTLINSRYVTSLAGVTHRLPITGFGQANLPASRLRFLSCLLRGPRGKRMACGRPPSASRQVRSQTTHQAQPCG